MIPDVTTVKVDDVISDRTIMKFDIMISDRTTMKFDVMISDMTTMKFDDLVKRLGEFGPYQKRVYFLLCLPAITGSMQTFIYVFSMGVPGHRYIPLAHIDEWTLQHLLLSFPLQPNSNRRRFT